MENLSPLKKYYRSRVNHYMDVGLDEEEAEFEAYGDYYKNYSSIKALFNN